MGYTLQQFRARAEEHPWLDDVMALRFGGSETVCPGCRRRTRFNPVAHRPVLACTACGHRLAACEGTPFEKPLLAPLDWLFALYRVARARGEVRPGALQEQLGCSYKTAWRAEQEIRHFLSGAGCADAAERWARGLDRALEPGGAGLPVTDPGLGGGTGRGPRPAPERIRPHQVLRLARAHPNAAVVVGLVGVTALAVGLAAALTDRSGRLDGARQADLASPPALTLAMLTSARRRTASINGALPGEEEGAGEDPVGGDRAGYDSLIQEGTAPGPRDPDQVLEFGPVRIRRHLVETIVRAARATGSDPVLLMAIADKESSFSTTVKARTSSATGLFQFIEKTWLNVVHDFGARHGLEREAKAIAWVEGSLVVEDPAEKARILDLRRDPYLSAVLAGEMLNRDRRRIAGRIGRDLTHGETYLAHFLGPDGAERFMSGMVSEPTAIAAKLLPKPASANRSIFFAQSGGRAAGRSLAEVHGRFEAMMHTRLDRYRDVQQVAGASDPAPAQEPVSILRIGQAQR